MGMCYTVNITLKYKLAYESTVKMLINVATDTYHNGLPENTSIADMLRLMFPKIHGKRTDKNGIVTLTGDADFDASYGWDSCMTEWFEGIASMLLDGSELEIFPDNGYEKLYVENGDLYRVDMEYANWHRILFSYNGIMYGLDVADATIDDPEDLEKKLNLQMEYIEDNGEDVWDKIGVVSDKEDKIKIFGCYEIDNPALASQYQPVKITQENNAA